MLRENVGKLAVILAGGGCLALMIFVVWPQMNEPTPSMTPGEIVEEVLGPEAEQADEARAGADEMVMPVPSPLVAVRDDGEAMAVIFPAPEGETPEAQETGDVELPPVLSAEDVASARAALEGDEEGAGEGAGPVDPAAGMTPEDWVRAASAPDVEPLGPDEVQGPEVAAVPVEPEATETMAAEAVVEPRTDAGEEDAEGDAGDAGAADVEREAAPEALELIDADRAEGPGEVVLPDDDGGPLAVERPLAAAETESQAPTEAPDPSGGLPSPPALEAGQADGPNSGLSPRKAEIERAGVLVPGTLRGVMGYRLPLVSRQEVPDQIVSGVLIPAHTTFVILKEGSWELVDVSADELEQLRRLAAERESAATEPEPEPEKPGWNPLRMLRKREAPADE